MCVLCECGSEILTLLRARLKHYFFQLYPSYIRPIDRSKSEHDNPLKVVK